uniref:Putative secreted protein n=1 Tax=Ixodes ricinus TaxID=34613 RepID=A0A6B0V110_IXORI
MAYVTPSRCVRHLSAALLSVRASSAKSPKAGLTRQACFLIFSLWASTTCLRLCGGLQRDALGNRFLQALIYIRRDQAMSLSLGPTWCPRVDQGPRAAQPNCSFAKNSREVQCLGSTTPFGEATFPRLYCSRDSGRLPRRDHWKTMQYYTSVEFLLVMRALSWVCHRVQRLFRLPRFFLGGVQIVTSEIKIERR